MNTRNRTAPKRHVTGTGLFAIILLCSTGTHVSICSAASSDIAGGITGIVYTTHDSLGSEWIPLPDVVVLVERSERDSLIVPQVAEIDVSFNRVNPKIQVAQPGAPLKITATGTRPTRLTARMNSDKEIFTVALPLPSLEVIKRLSIEGIITFHNAELDPDSILARIIVTPHLGWTKTDTGGVYLIPGIPPKCHSIWCYDPTRGSAFDTVCVEPARAVSHDLFLPGFLFFEPDDGRDE